MPCKHYKEAAIYAKQMAEMDEPWKLWQWKSPMGGWNNFNDHFAFNDCYEYRQITKTIKIGSFDVLEPMREKPEIGTEYFTVDLTREDGCGKSEWNDDHYDNRWLTLGICHLTREDCIAHAKALFSFSEIKE